MKRPPLQVVRDKARDLDREMWNALRTATTAEELNEVNRMRIASQTLKWAVGNSPTSPDQIAEPATWAQTMKPEVLTRSDQGTGMNEPHPYWGPFFARYASPLPLPSEPSDEQILSEERSEAPDEC